MDVVVVSPVPMYTIDSLDKAIDAEKPTVRGIYRNNTILIPTIPSYNNVTTKAVL